MCLCSKCVYGVRVCVFKHTRCALWAPGGRQLPAVLTRDFKEAPPPRACARHKPRALHRQRSSLFPTLAPRPLRRKAPWLSVVLIIVPRPPCQHSPVLAALLRESLLDLHRKGLLSMKCPPSTPHQALRGQPCSQLLRGSAGARGLEDWLTFAIASGAHGDALGAGHCPAGLPCASTGTSV